MKRWQHNELESVACDFCGTHEVCAKYIRGDGMRVVECALCGLAYLNPRPLIDLIPQFYEQDYFTGAAAARGEGGLKLELDAASVLEGEKQAPRSIELINERFGGLQGKDVLEIGCATGDLLAKLAQQGARAKGLEISDFAAKIARSQGRHVTTGTIEEYVAGDPGVFDIVMAFEVIEHVISPTRFLDNVTKLLKPEGILLLSTPNYSCSHRFGREWFGFTCSFEHLYFFNVETLRRLAHRAGCTLRYWETTLWNGGPSKVRKGFLYNSLSRFSKLSYYVMEEDKAITEALRALWLRKLSHRPISHRPFGSGHTLSAVFLKDA